MAALIAEGKITSKQFDDEVARTPRAFYEALGDDLRECLAALQELDRSNDEHFGRDAPSLVGLRKALDDLRGPLQPDPPGQARSRSPTPSRARRGRDPRPSRRDGDESEAPEVPAPRRARAPRSSGGARRCSAEDRRGGRRPPPRRAEQPGPVPRGPGAPHGRALRPAPAPGRLAVPGADQRDAADAAKAGLRGGLGRAPGAGRAGPGAPRGVRLARRPPLRPRRHEPRATSTARRRPGPPAACSARSSTTSPISPTAELGDGTPTASAETRAWLKEEGLTGPSSGPAAMAYEPTFSAASSEPAGAVAGIRHAPRRLGRGPRDGPRGEGRRGGRAAPTRDERRRRRPRAVPPQAPAGRALPAARTATASRCLWPRTSRDRSTSSTSNSGRTNSSAPASGPPSTAACATPATRTAPPRGPGRSSPGSAALISTRPWFTTTGGRCPEGPGTRIGGRASHIGAATTYLLRWKVEAKKWLTLGRSGPILNSAGLR